MSSPTEPAAAGVIHDIGYQRYQGARLGRAQAIRSLYVHSLRTAFGLGRSARSKLLPGGLVALGSIAALILTVVNILAPTPAVTPTGLVSAYTFGMTAFVAVVAPELVSRDLRVGVLPLYFSRPLQRRDYALTKLAALSSAVLLAYGIPLTLMLAGTLVGGGSQGAGAAVTGYLQAVGLAAVHAVVLAAVALPLAAASGRRVVATGLVIGVFLITAPVAGALGEFASGTLGDLAGVLDPVSLLGGIDRWLFDEGPIDVGASGPAYGLAAIVWVAATTTALLWRYRRVNP